jgi:hypothetical protein
LVPSQSSTPQQRQPTKTLEERLGLSLDVTSGPRGASSLTSWTRKRWYHVHTSRPSSRHKHLVNSLTPQVPPSDQRSPSQEGRGAQRNPTSSSPQPPCDPPAGAPAAQLLLHPQPPQTPSHTFTPASPQTLDPHPTPSRPSPSRDSEPARCHSSLRGWEKCHYTNLHTNRPDASDHLTKHSRARPSRVVD